MIHTLALDDVKEFNENLEAANQGGGIGFKLGGNSTNSEQTNNPA
jgi:hypothetical protein